MRPPYISGRVRLAGLVLVVALIGLAIGYGVALQQTQGTTDVADGAKGEREVLYWYDPMVPNQRFDKPGKSPFMDMELVPKYADEADGPSGARIDPAAAQNLGVRLATVESGILDQTIDATGVIEFNERDLAVVQARSGGFVERTYRRAPGDVVARGAAFADLYIPDWASAQTEFLALRATGEAELIAAGRQRLRLAGMPAGLIAEVERTGRPRPVVTVTTPISGVVQTLNVRPGMTVAQGETLAEVNGLSTVWVTAAVPEAQAGLVRVGQAATVELAAYPGESFGGRVSAVLPEAQTESRTLEIRIELPNRQGRLRPGMFATVHLFAGANRPALLVPSEAVIRTGRRNLVMLAQPNGRYQPAEVRIGREANGRTEILAGLRQGERIVASGQFLIDSEASLSGLQARGIRTGDTASPPRADGASHQSQGRIEALSAGSVTLSHAPVPALGWPAMTMTFKLQQPQTARGLEVGDQVSFSFQQRPEGPIVQSMSKTGSGR